MKARITNFIISTNMLTNISHYIPRTVAASSLQGLPLFRAGAGGAALQPRLAPPEQNVPQDRPAMYVAPRGALQLDRRVVGQASRRCPAGSKPSPRRGGGTCASLASICLRARTGATCRAETSSSHLRRRQNHPRQGGTKREDRPHVT